MLPCVKELKMSSEKYICRFRIECHLLNLTLMQVMEGINTLSKERGRIIDFKEVLYGYYRVNPRFGVDYILDILLVYKKYRGRKMTFPVRRHAYLQQPFGPLALRQTISVPSLTDKKIYFILPLAGRLPVFQRFLQSYERVCLQTGLNVRLVVVLFPTFTDDDPRSEIRTSIENCRKRFGRTQTAFDVQIMERQERFARATALEVGASSCHDDCLLVFIDVDMDFTADTLHRIRSHTIRHKQVYFPIVFSQYDPFFGTNESAASVVNAFDINRERGYWRFYGFGIASLYRSDLQRVGGLNVSIRGWGQEDVDLFDRIVRTNLTVFRAPDPGLVHVYHPVFCDKDLEPKQFEMCLGTRSNTFASQRRLAELWLEQHRPD